MIFIIIGILAFLGGFFFGDTVKEILDDLKGQK